MFRRTAEQRRVWSRNANAAKARKRMAHGPVESEPRMTHWNRFSITITDKMNGETGVFDLRSVRDAAKRLTMILRYI